MASNMARAMLRHSAAHWKNGVDSSLWPIAVTYTINENNNTPNATKLVPCQSVDCEYGSTSLPTGPSHMEIPCAYVLDPLLQDGKKLL